MSPGRQPNLWLPLLCNLLHPAGDMRKQSPMAGLFGGILPKPLISRMNLMQKMRARLPPPQLTPRTRLMREMLKEARQARLLRNSIQPKQHMLHQARLTMPHPQGKAMLLLLSSLGQPLCQPLTRDGVRSPCQVLRSLPMVLFHT